MRNVEVYGVWNERGCVEVCSYGGIHPEAAHAGIFIVKLNSEVLAAEPC